jgi:MtN3 and saliva related transmembrane protein
MDATEVAGIAASIFTGIALLPQLIKIFKEKNAEGTSWLMLSSLFIGLSLWVLYGARKEDPIIIISNAFAWTVNCTVIILSLKYRGTSKVRSNTMNSRDS